MTQEDDTAESDLSNQIDEQRRILLKLAALGGGVNAAGLSTGTALAASEFVDILSVDPSNYPEIHLNIRVDTEAGRDGELTEEDFKIIENDVEQAIESFSFASTSADVVFVFDDTGSMFDEIAAMKSGVKGLTDDIESTGIDARYGLVSFKDFVETDLAFTDDADALKAAVDSLSAFGGGDGPEDNFDAIMTALDLGFRDDAQKVVVDITDAPSHYDGDGSGVSEHTLNEVATNLTESGAAYIAVAPDLDDPDASKKTLANEIGGLWIDIASADFSVILEEITEVVVTAYVVEYITDAAPGESRTVGVEVTDPEEGTDSDSGSLEVPIDAGDGVSLDSLIESKQSKIDSIQSAAAVTMGEEEATTTVDQKAQTILDEIDSKRSEASMDELHQFEEALERMNAAEHVTQAATDGGTSEGSIVDDAARDIWAVAKSLAMDVAGNVAKGLIEKIGKAAMDRLHHVAGGLLDALAGNGIIDSETVNTLSTYTSSIKTDAFSAISAVDDDALEDIADAFADKSVDAAIDVAEANGLMSTLDDTVADFRNAIEEFLFEDVYYGHPPLPALYIPTPDELEIPGLDVTIDVPDELVPWWLGGGSEIPDELRLQLDPSEISLPEVPVLDDVNDVRTGAGISDDYIEGINPTIDSQMIALNASIAELSMQSPSIRSEVAAVGTGGLNGIISFVDTIVDVLEFLQQDVLGLAEDKLNSFMNVLPLVGAGLYHVGGGLGILATVAAAIVMVKVTLVIGGYKMLINKLQLAAGAGALPFISQTHHVTTKALLTTDLGGVTID